MDQFPQAIQSIHNGIDKIAHRSFREHVRFIKAAGLSMSQFGILMQLYHQHHCGITEIGSQMDISSAAASQLVEKLVQGGLLSRAENPHDRRVKQLALSEKGLELVQAGYAARHSWLDSILEGLTPDEHTKVAEAMQILAQALGKTEEKAE